MKFLKKAIQILEEQYTFIGDCETGLNDPEFRASIASNVADLTELVAASDDISMEEFVQRAKVNEKLINEFESNPNNYWFFENAHGDVLGYWDHERNIHYFYSS